MKYEQPDFASESSSERFIPPMLHLPQIPPLPETPLPKVETRHSQQTPSRTQCVAVQPRTEPLGGPSSVVDAAQDETAFLPRPQRSFPVHHQAIARSLRSGVTYIPPSMKRSREMNMVDVGIACVVLLLFILLLYCYFSA